MPKAGCPLEDEDEESPTLTELCHRQSTPTPPSEKVREFFGVFQWVEFFIQVKQIVKIDSFGTNQCGTSNYKKHLRIRLEVEIDG